jgi:DNA polymerase III delta prime subunit
MSNVTCFKPLLSEVLRPQALADINLPDHLIASLERMVQSGSMMNLLFYGKPGIGKTSAARILLRELDVDVLELNGSFNNGDKTMVKRIENFASTVSLLGKPKVVFIDEADQMSKDVQASLRYPIEQMSGHTRFLMTANEVEKLTPAIRSRCLPICFDVSVLDAPAVVERMVGRYEEKLTENGYSPDPNRLREIVSVYFPDLRTVANQFQLELG